MAALVVAINLAVTFAGCHIHSYSAALYIVHPLFTTFYVLQSFSHFTIVWLSYDRFLAVWFYHYYRQTQQPIVKRHRIIFTGLFCIVINLRQLVEVSVVCFNKGVIEVANNTNCKEGSLYINDVVQEKGPGMVWQDGLVAVRIVLLMIVPAVLVLVFSSGIVLGLVRHRLQNIAATAHSRDQALSAIYITLILSFTFIIMIVGGVTFVSVYSMRCHGSSFTKEVFRTALYFSVVGEHAIHIFFLAINQIFRDELKILLNAMKQHLTNIFVWMVQTCCPSFCTRSTSTMHKTHITDNPQLAQPTLSSAGEQTNERTETQTSVDDP